MQDGQNIFFSAWIILIIPSLVIAHKLLHKYGALLSKHVRVSDTELGFILKKFTPYCHFKKAMPRNDYMLAIAFPLIFTGIAPLFTGLAMGNDFLTIFSIFAISACAGDLLMIFKLKNIPKEVFIKDLKDEPGFEIIRKEAL